MKKKRNTFTAVLAAAQDPEPDVAAAVEEETPEPAAATAPKPVAKRKTRKPAPPTPTKSEDDARKKLALSKDPAVSGYMAYIPKTLRTRADLGVLMMQDVDNFSELVRQALEEFLDARGVPANLPQLSKD